MRILVCGEYGVFCKNLITRLKKENHQVFVITGSQKEKRPKPVAGVFQDYHFSYRSKNIGSIMKNIQPDLMIMLGVCDVKFSWKNINEEAVRYITSMTNLLMGAREAGVKQVIYCSSLDVYEGYKGKQIDDFTDFAAGSMLSQTFIQMEYLCSEQQTNDFHISVIRYPKIYGDYQCAGHNICEELFQGFWLNQPMEVAKDRSHRLLYVKDGVDMLMRVLLQEPKANAYLVPGTIHKEGDILKIIESLADGTVPPILEKTNQDNPLPQVVDDLTDALGFYEKYDLIEGLSEYATLWTEERRKDIKSAGKKSVVREKLMPFLENVGLFSAVTILYILLNGTWLVGNIDFYLLYVVAVAAVYGSGHGLIAAFLAFLAKTGEILFKGMAFEYASFTGILQILVIAVVVGYMTDKYKRKNGDLEDEKRYYQSELVDITRIYDGNRYIKEVYEKRLVNYENSMARICQITSQLDFLEPQKVIFQAVDVTKQLMEIEDVAIYIDGGHNGYMRLGASSSPQAKVLGNSIAIDHNFFMYKDLVEGQVYRNHDIDSDLPVYGCGIFDSGALIAIVMLWTRDLEKINMYEANMLAMICKLIESSMNRAATYWSAAIHYYHQGTRILKEKYFKHIFNICKEGAKDNKLEYVLIKIPIDWDKALGKKAVSLVRQNDVVGEVDGTLYVILLNASNRETHLIVNRFQMAEIPVEQVVEE